MEEMGLQFIINCTTAAGKQSVVLSDLSGCELLRIPKLYVYTDIRLQSCRQRNSMALASEGIENALLQ